MECEGGLVFRFFKYNDITAVTFFEVNLHAKLKRHATWENLMQIKFS